MFIPMMQDFGGIPANLYNRQNYERILSQLTLDQSQQIDALNNLSNLLIYGNPDILDGFPLEPICHQLVRILDQANSEVVANLSSSCIFAVLEAHHRSTHALFSAGALGVLSNHLLHIRWLETSQNCIKALEVISHYKANDLAHIIGLDPLLNNIDFFPIMIQKVALTAAENITKHNVMDDFAKHLEKLIQLSKSSDQKIHSTSIKIIDNIASSVKPDSVTPEVIVSLCSSSNYLKALINLSINPLNITRIINTNVNFEKFFNEAKNSESQEQVLKLVLNLLPFVKILNMFNNQKHKRPQESNAFAITIQPLILSLIMDNPLSLRYLLMCFASTLIVHKIELNEELAVVLKGFGKSPEISPYVLAVLTFYEDSPLLAETRILDVLSNIALSNQQKKWFTRNINRIRKKVNKNLSNFPTLDDLSLDQLISLILNNNISKLHFLLNGVKRCCQLISSPNKSKTLIRLNRNLGQISINSDLNISKENAQILADYLISLLSFADLPPTSDASIIEFYFNRLNKSSPVLIKLPNDETVPLKVSKFDTVASVESWYNYQILNMTPQKLFQLASKRPEIKSLIFTNQNKITYGQMSMFYRLLDKNYPRYHINDFSNSTDFDVSTSFFSVLNDDGGSMEFFHTFSRFETFSPQKILLVEGDCHKNVAKLPEKTYDSLTDILNLLKTLSEITEIGQNSRFSRKIHNLLANPSETLHHTSLALSTIYISPSLFPFETRFLAFKLLAYDPKYALKALMNEFNVECKKFQADNLKITIHRDSIFNEGCVLLTNLCSNQSHIEVSYIGEEGIGLGPTREFFTLFSHELCLNERKLFRSEERRRGYVVNRCGMFFSPMANPKATEILGIFLAKSLQMECVIDINLNPALFKLIRNKPVSLEEIDPILANSIKDPSKLADAGLTFIYPGYEIPMKANGDNIDVTSENVYEYIQLINDYTYGSKMKPLIDGFIKGFNSVIQFQYLDVFNEDEIVKIFAGVNPKISYEDLEKNVIISHGYNPNDKEIKMLFEVITEMDADQQKQLIQFITGYSQLPIGGLSALEPKLTIAKKIIEDEITPDKYLPSVMTCTNYFKVPPYSSKQIMLEKIRVAISEGRNSFDLT